MNKRFKTLEEALDWMWQTPSSKINGDKVERMKYALELLGNPHKDLPAIHLTGTNGKGSTLSMLKTLLMSQGLKVGTFSSPHLTKFNERICINGVPISDEDLAPYVERVLDVEDEVAKTEHGSFGFFERYTLIMCLYFYDKKPDVAIIEVGIGGAHDASNVIDASLSAITTIAIDHTDILGGTIKQITTEKAGIIKDNAQVVLGRLPEEATYTIMDVAEEKNAEVYAFGKEFLTSFLNFDDGSGTSTFNFKSKLLDDEDYFLQFNYLGLHQVDNAGVALQLWLLWMKQQDLEVDWQSARTALLEANWPGRMEKLSDRPLIYIDGAHNLAGVRALTGTVNEYFPSYKLHIVYAGLSTKDQTGQLQALGELDTEVFVVTSFTHQNALSAEELKEQAPFKVFPVKNWKAYLRFYQEEHRSSTEDLLIITGSLYFISEVRNYYKSL